MKTSEAVEFFGSVGALAEVLQISPQAIYQWGESVPQGRDFQLEVLTRGKLRAPRTHPSPQPEARS